MLLICRYNTKATVNGSNIDLRIFQLASSRPILQNITHHIVINVTTCLKLQRLSPDNLATVKFEFAHNGTWVLSTFGKRLGISTAYSQKTER